MKLNPHIFREYDIRGLVGRDLDQGVAYRIGRAFAARLAGNGLSGQVLVARDNRRSSQSYAEALGRGLAAGGLGVNFAGEVPTPVFYHAALKGRFPAGVMVTASHNPPEYNGFKLIRANESVHGAEIRELYGLAASMPETPSVPAGPPAGAGKTEAVDPYARDIADRIRPARPVKAVLDCGNGVAGPVALPVLGALGAEIIPLYCESDPDFPNHQPDPSKSANMRDLAEAVRKEGAEVGIGIDADGDRIGLCDEKGEMVRGDTILALLLRTILPARPGAAVVFDVKCSRALGEEIERLGGRPVEWRTGHSLVEAKMHRENAVAGGELSGHLYLNDAWYGFDDAIYAAARVIHFLAGETRPLSSLIGGDRARGENNLRRYFTGDETRLECPDEEKFALVEKIKAAAGAEGLEISDIDGVKVLHPDGWGLVRASNTEPALVMRVEAETEARRAEIEAGLRRWVETLT